MENTLLMNFKKILSTDNFHQYQQKFLTKEHAKKS